MRIKQHLRGFWPASQSPYTIDCTAIGAITNAFVVLRHEEGGAWFARKILEVFAIFVTPWAEYGVTIL